MSVHEDGSHRAPDLSQPAAVLLESDVSADELDTQQETMYHHDEVSDLVGKAVVAFVTRAADALEVAHDSEVEPDADQFVTVTKGRKLRITTFFDREDDRNELTQQVVQGRTKRYVEKGIWSSEETEDETLGNNVEVVAVIDMETGEVAASLRKVHTTGDKLSALPSYDRFVKHHACSRQGLEMLKTRAVGRPVVEIAALWKNPAYDADVTAALSRRAIQDSFKRGELWFLGVLSPEYRLLRKTYGAGAVHLIGDSVPVDDGKANCDIRIHPVLIDPRAVFIELADQADTAYRRGRDEIAAAYETWMWYFASGIEDHLDEASLTRMKEILDGAAA